MEVLNGSTDLLSNRKAYRIAVDNGLKTIGASDAHVYGKIASYVTYLPEEPRTLEEFIAAMRTSRGIRAAHWETDHYCLVESLDDIVGA